MKISCETARDLLPLYVDGIVSDASKRLVEEHLAECRNCTQLLAKMQHNEAETDFQLEKAEVIEKQKILFKRKSAFIGIVVSGVFMIPILVCLIVNLAIGEGLTWFFIVLASLLLTASLTVVPLVIPKNKVLWTLGGFTAALILLFGVCCIYTGGNWFFVASSASLFGLGTAFGPFAVRSLPLPAILNNKKALAIMIVDTLLYGTMMLSIGLYTKEPDYFRISMAISVPLLLFSWTLFAVIRYVGKSCLLKAGICTAFSGVFTFFADYLINMMLGSTIPLPSFLPLEWNFATVDGNVKWLVLILGILLGTVFIIFGFVCRRKQK